MRCPICGSECDLVQDTDPRDRIVDVWECRNIDCLWQEDGEEDDWQGDPEDDWETDDDE